METTTGPEDLRPFHQMLSPRFSSPPDIAFAVLTCILSFTNNSLTIITVVKSKRGIAKRAKLFIISLSACDTIMVPSLAIDLYLSSTGCLHKPIFIVDGNEDIMRCTRWARTLLSILYTSSLGISFTTLFLVAADRAFAVTKPIAYRHYVTDFKVKVIIVSSWVYVIMASCIVFGAFGLSISPAYVLSTFHPCDVLPPVYFEGILMTHVYFLIVGTVVAYVIAYHQFRKASRTISGSDKDKRRMERDKRFLTMVLATVVSLAILWTPYQVLHKAYAINRPDTPDWVRYTLQPTAYAITNCNSWLNPVFYFVLNKDFRRAYISLLSRNSVQPVRESSTY